MKIKVEQYNPLWKESFNQIKVELSEVMASLNPQIEHIGSTAVEGLSAKPIIDILIGVDDIDELNIIPALLMEVTSIMKTITKICRIADFSST
ncbi:GrpB-like predicted nucleotidyltransferase (UPF0157 family) [Pedobacter cryoconitis]|uniref:GrpB-like predicted nucleotidyltransferase (UPF0157 family) n=1 Tax=Pedobacter cryoconitis TaxID=188932 RepID=A0A7W9DLR4_9SPHI|nr:GrpB-like predicted nucleotidyltransferase (UPF0157 family) [Pedobacter cryoconitis]